MAIIKTNSVLKGISGAIGNLVFRQVYGKTIVSRKPSQQKQSAQQRETRNKFKHASLRAKIAMRDPEKKAWFWDRAKERKLPNAYTAALSHYMSHDVDAPQSTI